MPLLSGKKNIGRNISTEESSGKSKAQSVAIALHKADVLKAKDDQPALATQPNGGMPWGSSREVDGWKGRVV